MSLNTIHGGILSLFDGLILHGLPNSSMFLNDTIFALTAASACILDKKSSDEHEPDSASVSMVWTRVSASSFESNFPSVQKPWSM